MPERGHVIATGNQVKAGAHVCSQWRDGPQQHKKTDGPPGGLGARVVVDLDHDALAKFRQQVAGENRQLHNGVV